MVAPAVENNVGAFAFPVRFTVSVPIFVPSPMGSPTVADAVPPNQQTFTVPDVTMMTSRMNEPATGNAAEFVSIVTLPDVRAVLVAADSVIFPL